MARKTTKKEPGRKRIPLADRKRILRLTLMDNEFMNAFFDGELECVQEMLRVILKKEGLVVKSVKTQWHLQGLKRSVSLDIFEVDDNNQPANIEIQNASEGADPRRARFHSAIIDVHTLKMGQDFDKLPDHYVIFITREDVLGLGKMIYTIHRTIDGEGVPFNDGSHIIYVNAAAEDDGSELAKLIHDLRCPDPDKMYFPNLAARMRFFKKTEEGVEEMSGVFEDIRREAAEKAEKKAAKKAAKQVEAAEMKAEQARQDKENLVLSLLKLGKMTLEEIAACSGFSVRKLRAMERKLV